MDSLTFLFQICKSVQFPSEEISVENYLFFLWLEHFINLSAEVLLVYFVLCYCVAAHKTIKSKQG